MKSSIVRLLFVIWGIVLTSFVIIVLLSPKSSVIHLIANRTYKFGLGIERDSLSCEQFLGEQYCVDVVLADQGIPIKKRIFLINQLRADYFNLLLLIDFKQFKFALEDKELYVHQVFMRIGESTFEIEIPPLPLGEHLALLLVVSTSVSNRDLNFIHSIRFKIAVGTDHDSRITKSRKTFLQGQIDDFLPTGFGLWQLRDGVAWEYLSQIKVPIGGLFTAHVVIKNLDSESKSYAVLLVRDWEQVPLRSNDLVLYVYLNPKEGIAIPIELNIDKPRSQVLAAILVEDPELAFPTKVVYLSNCVVIYSLAP